MSEACAIDYDRPMALHRNAKVELLKRIPLFARCSKKELAAIASEADELDLPAGRPLTVEGSSGREFVVIVDGKADVYRSGKKVNSLGDGDFLGRDRSAHRLAANCHRHADDAVPCAHSHGPLVPARNGSDAVRDEKVMQALAERLADSAV